MLYGIWFWWLNLEKNEETGACSKNIPVQSEGKSCLGATLKGLLDIGWWELVPFYSGESSQSKVKHGMNGEGSKEEVWNYMEVELGKQIR